MIDVRLYRAAFLPSVLALVALMFSVEGNPPAQRSGSGTVVSFDAHNAAKIARAIAERAPSREPGSEGDSATADLVTDELATITAGAISEQTYETSFDGEDVVLRNVILTLPGTSDRTIVVLAHRDSIGQPDAASTASATGVLMEVARSLGTTRHEDTLVFVSTDGGSDGASGARRFLAAYPTPELIDAVVVISQPGAADPFPPHVVAFSAGRESSSAQLVQSAKEEVEAETGGRAGLPGLAGSLLALALPSGLGEQAPLIADGADAVTLSGAGERPYHGSEQPAARPIGDFGRAAVSLVTALDGAETELSHGPGTYLVMGDNLIPGWPLAALALALLLPAAAVAIDGLARAGRQGEPVLAALIWGLARALPFLAPLLLAYLLGLLGIAPAPDFPFDPERFGIGFRAVAVMLVLAVAFAIALLTLKPLAVPSRVDRETLCPALGILAVISITGIWLVNPYLALLLVPFGHLWILGARPNAPVPAPVIVIGCAIAVLPLAAAVIHLVDRLDLGAAAPWQLLLMLTGGQIPVVVMLLGCLLGASALGTFAISRVRRTGFVPSSAPEGVPLERLTTPNGQ